MNARIGMAATLSIIAAIASFFVRPVPGFFLALLAIFLGIIGFVMAASPRVRGGIISIFSIIIGVIGVLAAVLRGIL
jgi:hypothetical protein